ncbi:MAG: hypothetical protein GF344_02130 [Chitinivibrionales bacterium]|nr:hypothetical protein [Chitinivibrionales bacterium]MBD3355892.1 hypothetical protein [Chitinivibrionales bacterium]
MKILTHALAVFLTGAVVLWLVLSRFPAVMEHEAVMDLIHISQAVEKSLDDLSSSLERQVSAFGAAVAEDRNFAMKLIVENDTSASEVTGIAGRYMEPMGFDVLEISTPGDLVLSWGHFPARAGELNGGSDALIGGRPLCVVENIKGKDVLTLQAGSSVRFAEQTFHCSGGVIVDEELLRRLTPRNGVRVILRRGTNVIGLEGVETISDVENNRIIVNDETFPASSVTLPSAGLEEPLELIVIMDKPVKFSPLELL